MNNDELLFFLDNSKDIPRALVEQTKNWWIKINELYSLPLPIAGMTADEERFQLAWSYEKLLIEIDISSDGKLEWFALERDTNNHAIGYLDTDANISNELHNWLSKLSEVKKDHWITPLTT